MKKNKKLTRSELKEVLGGVAQSEFEVENEGLACAPPGAMCNSHSECCKSMSHTVICLINTGNGFGYCTIWN